MQTRDTMLRSGTCLVLLPWLHFFFLHFALDDVLLTDVFVPYTRLNEQYVYFAARMWLLGNNRQIKMNFPWLSYGDPFFRHNSRDEFGWCDVKSRVVD